MANKPERLMRSIGGVAVAETEDGTAHVRIQSSGDIVAARQAGRALGSRAGFSVTDLTVIVTAISEIARNILQHAREGEVRITIINGSRDGDGATGVEITASDTGPGIPETATVMRDFYSTGSGLGIGLPGARRLMDEFEITSTAGRGTLVRMRKWV